MEKSMKNNIILVDLFDTLVFRKARLYRLVRYWAEELCRCFEMNMSAQEIIRMRGEFYDTLLTQNEEVKYSALIRKIYLSLSQEQLLENTTFEEFFSICHYLELKYEIQSQFINEKLVRWLRDQKSLNKRIYCISDFYLSREDVLHFLHKLEIDDIFSDVFVSCDWNQTKRSGNLYRKVLEEIQAAPEDCLMIGDNLKSDIRMAKKQSIKAKHVPRYLHVIKNFVYQIKDDKRQRKIILQGLARKYKNKKSPFCEFVLFFYILTEKIYVNARRDHLKNLIFLSREGLFLKKMFDYYQEN
jgi:HAD superfamily hydrolase (TIGR01549 family)